MYGFLGLWSKIAIPLTCLFEDRVFVNVDSLINTNGDSLMCARPRRVADYDLMNAALHVVIERGADQTRLADVAAASGLAPATLVQRFGSREGLLDAVAEAFLHDLRAAFQSDGLAPMAQMSLGLAGLIARSHFAFITSRP